MKIAFHLKLCYIGSPETIHNQDIRMGYYA